MASRRSSRIALQTDARIQALKERMVLADKEARKATAEPAPKPSRKKQKTSHVEETESFKASKPKRKRRSKLEAIAELPLDVLLEVFRHLGPGDLLNLSRATKALRAIVLDPNLMRSIWKDSFATMKPLLPLDAFPDDWNLPQIADMAYGRQCHGCDKPKGTKVYWPERLRVCGDCFEKMFVPLNFACDVGGVVFWTLICRYHKGHRMVLKESWDEIAPRVRELNGDKDATQALVQEMNKKLDPLRKFQRKMNHWEYEKMNQKARDLTSRQDARRASYKNKLEALGYKEELSRLRMTGLETLPGFKGSRPLSSKEWQRLKPDVVEIMNELRKTFANEKKSTVLRNRMAILSNARLYYARRHLGEIVPDVDDLAAVEPFHSLIFDTPIEETVAAGAFIPLIDSIASVSQIWRDAATETLLGLLPSTPAKGSSSKKGKEKAVHETSVLHKGTTLFSCAWCPEILTYPAALTHPCLIRKHRRRRSKDEQDDDGEESESESKADGSDDEVSYGSGTRWNEGGDQVEFDAEASEHAEVIVHACGLDPRTATLDEVDQHDARLECLRCRNTKSRYGRLVMTWRNALLHDLEKHSEETPSLVHWAVLSEDDLSAAKAKEAARQPPRRVGVCCMECSFLLLKDNKFGWLREQYVRVQEDGSCPMGHDMTHGTFELDVSKPITVGKPAKRDCNRFKQLPYPVKI